MAMKALKPTPLGEKMMMAAALHAESQWFESHCESQPRSTSLDQHRARAEVKSVRKYKAMVSMARTIIAAARKAERPEQHLADLAIALRCLYQEGSEPLKEEEEGKALLLSLLLTLSKVDETLCDQQAQYEETAATFGTEAIAQHALN